MRNVSILSQHYTVSPLWELETAHQTVTDFSLSFLYHPWHALTIHSCLGTDPVFYGHDGNDNLNWAHTWRHRKRWATLLTMYFVSCWCRETDRHHGDVCAVWTEWNYLCSLQCPPFNEIFYGKCRNILIIPVNCRWDTVQHNRNSWDCWQHHVLVLPFTTAVAPSVAKDWQMLEHKCE
jgi:hypothetical protein